MSISRFLRFAAPPLALAASAFTAAGLLSGCGSGGGTSITNPPQIGGAIVINPLPSPSNRAPIVRAAVLVLPLDGSVQMGAVTDTSITLAGTNVPVMKPGAVLVSGQGEGLLRTVLSSTVADGKTVVQTGPATLEDVFQQADIKMTNQSFGLADFTKVDLMPGVTIADGPAPTPNPDPSGKSIKTVGRSGGRSASKTFTVTLPSLDLTQGGGQVTAGGTISVTLTLDADIQIDNTGVQYVLFKPTVIGDLKVVGKSTVKTNFTKSFTYAKLDGAPITLQIGPVPVVFTPHFSLSISASGSADVGLTLTSLAHASATAGTEYKRATGWTTSVDWLKNGSFVVGKNLYATVDGSLTPAHLELGLDLYGAATGSIKADYPTVSFHLSHDSVPPAGLRFKETATYHAHAGYDVTILGRTLTSYNSGDYLNGTDQWADQFFPDNGGINLGVQ